MDLDFWDCFGRKKLCFVTKEIRYLGKSVSVCYPLIVYIHGRILCSNWFRHGSTTISYPQCSLTFLRKRYLHRCREQSFAISAYAMSAVGIDVMSSHTNTAESHTVSQDSRMHCKVQMNEWPLILWLFNCISTKEWDETCPSHLCLKSTNEDFRVHF